MTPNTEIDETLLTLEDVAHLLGQTDQLPRETVRKLVAVIGTDHRFAGHVERLESQARDAGIETDLADWPAAAFYCHRDFERLVAAEGWLHPAEVLDPDGEVGISYRELVGLAEKQTAHAREPGRLLAIQEKLERAWAEDKAKDAPVLSIASQLLDQEPDAAEQLLTHALAEYRCQRRRAEP